MFLKVALGDPGAFRSCPTCARRLSTCCSGGRCVRPISKSAGDLGQFWPAPDQPGTVPQCSAAHRPHLASLRPDHAWRQPMSIGQRLQAPLATPSCWYSEGHDSAQQAPARYPLRRTIFPRSGEVRSKTTSSRAIALSRDAGAQGSAASGKLAAEQNGPYLASIGQNRSIFPKL